MVSNRLEETYSDVVSPHPSQPFAIQQIILLKQIKQELIEIQEEIKEIVKSLETPE